MSNNIPAEFQALIDRLEQWKREATAILDPILEYGRKHPDIKLGASITDFVIERCKQYDQSVALLKSVVGYNEKWGILSYDLENEIKSFLDGQK